jgi:hypothetical protein
VLAQFLRDDGGGGLGIEEAMADNLTNDLVSPAIVGFGAALLALQGRRAVLEVLVPELKIALLAESILLGGLQRAEFTALALDKHRQSPGNVVVVGDRKGSVRADESCSRKVHGEHRSLLLWGCCLGEKNSCRPDESLFKYDGILSQCLLCKALSESTNAIVNESAVIIDSSAIGFVLRDPQQYDHALKSTV